MARTSTLSLDRNEPAEPEVVVEEPSRAPLLAVVLLFLALAGLAGFTLQLHRRTQALERQLAALTPVVQQAAATSRRAAELAATSEAASRAAAEGRQLAESEKASARQDAEAALQAADAARLEAHTAQQTAAQAQAEAERIRKQAEADVNRLQEALGKIGETRRTALGVVMNLGSDYLKFEFDKAELRAEDRELLSRVAGILLPAADDYTISVNGHTDDVGTEAYNLDLSRRRAQVVRDYLVQAGLPASIFTVDGLGKSRPLVPGASDQARRKNRRVELGIVHAQIQYKR